MVAWLSFEVSNGVMKDPYYYKCVTISKQAQRGRRNGLLLDEEFIRYPSKPVLKSLNASINHDFERGGRFSDQVKTWPLCQFNPKFPRKHIFQLITHTRHPTHSYPRPRKSEEGLTARVSISPGKNS